MEMARTAEERKPQITLQMQTIGRELDNLEESVSILRDHLKSISRNSNNVPKLDSSDFKPKTEESLVPLAMDLNGFVTKIATLSRYIRDMTGDIEL